jgi:ankyrin repeat protein
MPTAISSDDPVKEFVTAAHFNLEKVQEMLHKQPELLEIAYPWREDDPETAIMAAAHMGSRPIAEFLLEKGAPLAIYTAAMLGLKDEVRRLLDEDPANAKQYGAHFIPLMSHVALSGDTEIAEMVYAEGGTEGISFALHAAVAGGHFAMTQWLLDHGANDLNVKNFQEKTPLQVAEERGLDDIITLLKKYGAA